MLGCCGRVPLRRGEGKSEGILGSSWIYGHLSHLRYSMMFGLVPTGSSYGVRSFTLPGLLLCAFRTWMLWPVRPDVWRCAAEPAQRAFAAVANAIGRFEPVCVGVPTGLVKSARDLLDPATVNIVEIDQNDAWMRDTGPIFVVKDDDVRNRHVRGVDWLFNAWGGPSGGCYSDWSKDEAVAGTVLARAGAECYKANMILEVRRRVMMLTPFNFQRWNGSHRAPKCVLSL